MKEYYLDSASTTKPKEEVIQAMLPYLTEKWYNPSSKYNSSINVKKDIENVRHTIANYVDCNEDEIYFTSGGSEGNNMILQGFVNWCIKNQFKPVVITTCIEHKSILSCSDYLQSRYCDIKILDVNSNGLVLIKQLENILKFYGNNANRKILVSIQWVNNEIGTIQDMKLISRIVHQYSNAYLHTDAVQAFGKIMTMVNCTPIDAMTVSGHKIGCPKGIGFVYKSNDLPINPLIYGTQENGLRGGTENVAGIIGLGTAVKLIKSGTTPFINADYQMINKYKYFESELKKIGCVSNNRCIDEMRVENAISKQLPTILNVRLPYPITGESMIYLLDMDNIHISAGSACNSLVEKPSYVLEAIGLLDEEISRSIRISFDNTLERKDIDYIVGKIDEKIKLLKCEEKNND